SFDDRGFHFGDKNGILVEVEEIGASFSIFPIAAPRAQSARPPQFRQRDGKVLLFALAQHGDGNFVLFAATQQAREIATIANRVAVDLGDYIAGAKARLFGSASLFD